jgi:hypothetical protein
MLTHGKIWIAIDALARRYGLSPSGLAKRAGLEHVQAFPIPGGIPKSREQCESSVPW